MSTGGIDQACKVNDLASETDALASPCAFEVLHAPQVVQLTVRAAADLFAFPT
jgi:hypothetical protein